MHSFATSACRRLESISPFLFLWHCLLSQAGKQFMSLYVVRKSWDTDEFYHRNNNRRPSFLAELLQRSDESSWNSFLSCKGKPAPVTALPKTFQCLPQGLGMKSRVCARLKGDRAHLCRYNLFLSHLHSRLHHLDPSQARDPMGLCSSQSLSATSFSAPPFTFIWAGAPPKCSLP